MTSLSSVDSSRADNKPTRQVLEIASPRAYVPSYPLTEAHCHPFNSRRLLTCVPAASRDLGLRRLPFEAFRTAGADGTSGLRGGEVVRRTNGGRHADDRDAQCAGRHAVDGERAWRERRGGEKRGRGLAAGDPRRVQEAGAG